VVARTCSTRECDPPPRVPAKRTRFLLHASMPNRIFGTHRGFPNNYCVTMMQRIGSLAETEVGRRLEPPAP
jgi:hypothetical protein